MLFIFILFCSYCELEERFNILKDALVDQTRTVGLPDDYEYEEDNIYMQELEKQN